jgi:cytochrome c biogenesis factor
MTAYRWGRRLATTWVVAGGALALLAMIALLLMLFAMATSNPFQTFFASRLILPYIGAALLGIGIALSGFVARAVFDIADRKRT